MSPWQPAPTHAGWWEWVDTDSSRGFIRVYEHEGEVMFLRDTLKSMKAKCPDRLYAPAIHNEPPPEPQKPLRRFRGVLRGAAVEGIEVRTQRTRWGNLLVLEPHHMVGWNQPKDIENLEWIDD